MARVDGETQFHAASGSSLERAQGRALPGMVRVATRMQLDRDGAQGLGRLDSALIRVDEQARTNARCIHSGDALPDARRVVGEVKSSLGRDLLAFLWNERHLVRYQLCRDAEHLIGARHLEIQDCSNRAGEPLNVRVLDVSAIFPEMSGDAVRARVFTDPGGGDRIGFFAAPRLSDGRHMIDVDVQSLPPHRSFCCWHFRHPLGWQHRLGACVKKIAIVLLLVVASCRRTVLVSGPTNSMNGLPGARTPREAAQRFMAAAKSQDLQEMGLSWGTAEGPAIKGSENRDEKETREQREIILMCYLKHDTYRVLGEAPASNGERVLALEVKYKDLTRSTNLVAARGPNERWFVRQFDIEALRDICARKR